MYFLVDYENVNYAGLEGTEFITKDDTVCIFFSNLCKSIVAYRMMDIKQSVCEFEICKLKVTRKNALDFYIASKVAEILTKEPNAKIAIISGDKGFISVLDYWKQRLVMSNQMLLLKTIAIAMSFINGDTMRKQVVNERMSIIDLQAEYDKYQERRKIINKIAEVFKNTGNDELVLQIVDLIKASDAPKLLYLNSIKSFVKKMV